jgi:phosphatidylglycerophosphatase A
VGVSAGGRAAVFLATGGYLSYIPGKLLGRDGKWTGAGFIGTLEGLALLPLLPAAGAAAGVAVLVATLAACWICGLAEREMGRHDDSRIVLDEIVGMWVAAAWLPRTAGTLAAAFVLFRVLDSCKLPPYRWCERLPGGFGIVLDDVGAGICANLIVQILLQGGLLR